MAVLALGAVMAAGGAAAVSAGVITGITAITAAQIGWAIGTTLGSLLFRPDGPNVEGPRVNDLKVTTTAYGLPIPAVYGTIQVSGDYQWASELIETRTVHEQDSKGGGGGGSTTEYTYSFNCAIGLCEGEIGSVLRIWAGSYLFYDARDPDNIVFDGALITSLDDIRIYLGDETQVADSIEEAALGVGNVPGYRGTARVVLEGFELGRFGNRPPAFQFEVYKPVEAGSEDSITLLYNQSDPSHGVTLGRGGINQPMPTGCYNAVNDELWAFTIGSNAYWFARIDPADGTFLGSACLKVNPPLNNNSQIQAVDIDYTNNLIWIIASSQHIYAYSLSTGLLDRDLNTAAPNGGLGYMKVNPYTGRLYVSRDDPTAGVDYKVLSEVDIVSGSFDLSTTLSAGILGPLCESSGQYGYVGNAAETGVREINLTTFAETNYDIAAQAGTDSFFPTIYDEVNNAIWGTAEVFSPDYVVKIVVWSIDTHDVIQVLEIPAEDGGADAWVEPVLYDQYRNVMWIYVSDFFDVDFNFRAGDYDYLVGINLDDFSVFGVPINVSRLGELGVAGVDVDSDDIQFDFAVGPLGLYVTHFDASAAPNENDVYLIEFASAATDPYWQDVVSDVCARVGLGSSYLTLPEKTEEDLVVGYRITGQMTARAAIEPLQPCFYFDGVESGDTLKFVKRGGAVVATIPEDDLAAHEPGRTPAILDITRGQELELPKEVTAKYIRDANEYEQGSQYARREVTVSDGKATIEVPVVMSDEKGAQVANVNLYQAWLIRTRYAAAVARTYSQLEPTDNVLMEKGGVLHPVRLVRVQEASGIRALQGVREDLAHYTQPAPAAEALITNDQAPGEITDTTILLLDLPMLRDTDDDPGFYVVASNASDTWAGATLYRSVDGGATYAVLETFTGPGVIGTTAGALGDFTSGNVFDETNTVSVVLEDGELSSTTELGALNGLNAFAIGADGRWEIVIAQTATLTAPLTYTLSRFLRGRLGTEWAIPLHQAGDRVVLLSSGLKRISGSLAQIGVSRLYKAVTSGQAIADVTPELFTNTGVALTPYSPVQISGDRDNYDNITISWVRRTRLHWDSLDIIEAPLGEESERYEIDILDSDSPESVLRTLTSTEPSVVYSDDDQVLDFGTVQSAVHVKIYQMSATVGRGYAGDSVI